MNEERVWTQYRREDKKTKKTKKTKKRYLPATLRRKFFPALRAE